MKSKLSWLLCLLVAVPVAGQEPVNLVDYARSVYRQELKKIKGVRRMGALITTNFTGATDGDAAKFENWDNGLGRDGDEMVVPETTGRAITSNLGAEPAADTLNFSGNAANNNTVVIDSKTYTFQTSLTDVDGNVLIGADAAESRDNLVSAINLTSGSGSTYAASMTKHTTAYATAEASDAMDAIAKTAGTAGNSIVTTETLVSGFWNGGGTMGSGAASGVNPDLFFVEEGYQKDIMSSGTPATIAPAKMKYRGSGALYMEIVTTVSGSRLIVQSSNFKNAVTFSGSQNIENLEILRGKAINNNTGTMGTLWMASSQALFEASDSAGTITQIYMDDGTSEVNSPVISLIQAGGIHTQAINPLSSLVLKGGTYVPKSGGDGWVIMGGVCDFSRSVGVINLTNLTVTPSGTVIGDEDLVVTTRINIGE